MAEKIKWTPQPLSAWVALSASKPTLSANNFVPVNLWGYVDYNDITNTARQLHEEFFEKYLKDPANFKEGEGLLNSRKADVEFFEFAEKSNLLPDWWIKPAREWIQKSPDLSQYLSETKDIKPFGSIEFDDEGVKAVKPATETEYTIKKEKEYEEQKKAQEAYKNSPEYRQRLLEDKNIWLGRLSTDEARGNILMEINQQRNLLSQQGFNWSGSVSADAAAYAMADKLANAGVKSIYDLQIGKVEVDRPFVEGTREVSALINKRTGQAISPDYAFASMGETGGTWGGTFAGDPGATSFNIDFINGTPVFSSQFQPNKKSGIERIAVKALPLALGYFLGPAGYGLSSTLAGAIAGGASGLLQGGDIEDVLKQAALGGALGYGKEALFGAGAANTAASDLAAIEASMGTPGLLGSSNILDAINQAGVSSPDLLSGISPDVAAANLGALEASLGAFTGPTLPGLNFEPVLVPGDSLLSSTLAQPPLSVEDIAGRLTPEATALMGPPTGPMLPQMPGVPSISGGQVTGPNLPDLAGYEEAAGNLLAGAQQNFLNSGLTLSDFMSPETFVGPTMGDPTKAALLTGAGYGEGLTPGEAPIMTSTPTIIGPGKDVSALQIGKDIVGNLPGAMQQYVTTALTTLGLDADLVNKLVNWTPPTSTATTTQTGGGAGILGPVLGGLLSRQQGGAPAAPVTAGRAVDITSPIQALLAPKLVQQRPVSLL